MNVVDASILCGVLTREPAALAATRTSVEQLDPFHCPALIEAETLSALRGLERGGLLSRPEAELAASQLNDTRLVLYAFGTLSRRVWELRHDLSVHDASYVALTELLDDSVLLTGDRGLAHAARMSLGDERVQLV